MNRRDFLKITGGGVILSALSISGFVGTRTPQKALAPWDKAGNYSDFRLRALSYAILSPNPHNRQPWEIELIGTNKIKIYRNKNKGLPETDPFNRQLTIGMGCFIETLDIASREFGHSTDIRYFPSGDNGAVAEVTFIPDDTIKKDELFNSILSRRSCKEPFQKKALTNSQIDNLAKFGRVISKASDVENLKKITFDAFLVEYKTPRTLKESVDLMRLGKSEINASPDGIDIGGTFLEGLIVTGILTKESMMNPKSTAFAQGISIYDEMLNNTPNYIILETKTNNRMEQIDIGRKWVRLNLTTTHLGLDLHPVSQALQEYKEMNSLNTKIHNEYSTEGHTIQMLGRLGYGMKKAPQSPRWPIENKVINS